MDPMAGSSLTTLNGHQTRQTFMEDVMPMAGNQKLLCGISFDLPMPFFLHFQGFWAQDGSPYTLATLWDE